MCASETGQVDVNRPPKMQVIREISFPERHKETVQS